MKGYSIFLLGMVYFLAVSCSTPDTDSHVLMKVSEDEEIKSSMPFTNMSRDQLYDKILGSLVGSAIGDAMGAPTEMWPRKDIRFDYGYVDSLDNMIREPSPEGTWDYNLPAGGTTDDTRWHVFLGQYIHDRISDFYSQDGPDPYAFAQKVVELYETELEAIKNIDSFDPAPLEQQMRRIAWLQEFAMVAKPFAEKDLQGYSNAVNKFYGGDMACPGTLYSPVIGLPYPGAPELAYQAAYQLSFFDIGYARDIMALNAAMVAAAMPLDATPDNVYKALYEIDPQKYFKSRLLGRITYRIFQQARHIADEAKKVNSYEGVTLNLTPDMNDKLYMAQLQKAYELLDERNQDVPFHSGEIHLINLTALLFSDFDFRKAMEFVINYGRDNDTVAAVTGAILGAYYGFNDLPADMTSAILKTNKEKLGIDLELLANQMTDKILENKAVISE